MISPGPLFWRLSRNSEDVEFQEGSVLSSAHASFKVVRQMGQDWRGHPMARLRVVAAGFLGTKYLHKGTMYLAKIVPARAVETCRLLFTVKESLCGDLRGFKTILFLFCEGLIEEQLVYHIVSGCLA